MPKHKVTDDEVDQVDMWFTHHPPTESQIVDLQVIRGAARRFATEILVHTPPGPDREAALRKIREAVMTCNAAIVTPKLSVWKDARQGEKA